MSLGKMSHNLNSVVSENDAYFNDEPKENINNLDPVKAWIKNIDVGSGKKLSTRRRPKNMLTENRATPNNELATVTPKRKGLFAQPIAPPSSPATPFRNTILPSNKVQPVKMENATKFPELSSFDNDTLINTIQSMRISPSTVDSTNSDSSDDFMETTILQRIKPMNTVENGSSRGPQKNLDSLYAKLSLESDKSIVKGSEQPKKSTVPQQNNKICEVPQQNGNGKFEKKLELEQEQTFVNNMSNSDRSVSSLADNTIIAFNSTEISTAYTQINRSLNGSGNIGISNSK